LLPLSKLESASQCHNCGRCADYRGAIQLRSRASHDEIVNQGEHLATGWQTLLLLGGIIGLAMGAFHWSVSPWFITTKQWLAEYLINHDINWPLEAKAPWWLLTHYPENNDVFTWLDGGLLLAYVVTTAIVLGGVLSILLYGAAYSLGSSNARQRFNHLAQALIPLAACGIFLGLSAQTITLLRADGVSLTWISPLRLVLLSVTTLCSLSLVYRIMRRYTSQRATQIIVMTTMVLACTAIDFGWALMFWIW
jgi:hypothetical protein